MARQNPVRQTTLEEYLILEETSEVRHEFVDGYTFAMAGGTDYHGIIANNINVRAYLAAQNSDCTVFMENMTLLTPSGKGYYPDLFMTCEEPNDGSRFKRYPCWIVEVLSESTQAIDRGEKLHNYKAMPTLKAYVLVSQDQKLVEVYQQLEDKTWRYESLEEGILELPCLDLKISLQDIYTGVKFE